MILKSRSGKDIYHEILNIADEWLDSDIDNDIPEVEISSKQLARLMFYNEDDISPMEYTYLEHLYNGFMGVVNFKFIKLSLKDD